jgi:hypothetical protein
MKFGPADDFLRLPGVADLRSHDSARARFQGPHDSRIVGRSQADKGIKPRKAGGPDCVFDLLHGQPGVFMVQPDGIVAAMQTKDVDDFWGTELAQAEDTDELAPR